MTQPSETTEARKRRTLILGLGNTILTDDGVGIYVAREIGKHIQNDTVDIVEASLGGLELLDPMVGYARVILIDAMPLGDAEIGSLVKCHPEDLGGGSALARHQVPFQEALELGRRLGMDLPGEITIYGIQVKDTRTFGESCTADVASAIPQIVEKIIHDEFLSEMY